ncbi:hypothetical protein BSK60_32780 [Paenibacillus odorifer]|nr:hypothetical protein BSK60_32780 [Paenibacillus odorifer]
MQTIVTVTNHKEFELTIVKTASVGRTEVSQPMKIDGEHARDAWLYQMQLNAVKREVASAFRIPADLLKTSKN